MKGVLAAVVYRHAWRKAEEADSFATADDVVGTFTRRVNDIRDVGAAFQSFVFTSAMATQEIRTEGGSQLEVTSVATFDAEGKGPPPAECLRRIEAGRRCRR